jgi:UPF0716 protein FxsA
MPSPASFFCWLFVAAPLVELYLLIEVGSVIGALPTIALSIFTALLGGALVRVQGFRVLFRAQSSLEKREVPAFELLEGALLLLVGLALLLPGFVTDAIGFLLLVPPLRRRLIVRGLAARGSLGPAEPPRRGDGSRSGRILEGDYRRED